MSFNCVIPGCSSSQLTRTLFQFPELDEELLEKWNKEIPILDLYEIDLSKNFICEDHFENDQIIIKYDFLKELAPGAVPTIFNCDDNINLDACRFCLKFIEDSNERIPINDKIRRYFSELMNFELNEDFNLPDTTCQTCNDDLQKSVQLKFRISKVQKRLMDLLDKKIFIYPTPEIKMEIEEVNVDIVDPTKISTFDCKIKRETDLTVTGSSDNVSSTKSKGRLTSTRVLTIYKCKKCPKVFKLKPPYQKHIETVHSKEERPKSERKKNSKGQRDYRILMIDKVFCEICNRIYSRGSFAQHQKKFHEIRCDICGMVKYKKEDLDVHMQVYHKNNSNRKECIECNENFEDHENLQTHIIVTHLNKKNRCEICKITFNHETKFKSHMLPEHFNIPFEREIEINCKTCYKTFSSRRSCQNHEIRYHSNDLKAKKELKEKIKPKLPNSSEKEKVSCPICGDLYVKSNIKYHILRVHDKSIEKRLQCDICGKSQVRKTDMLYHMQAKHMSDRQRIPCMYCEKTFLRKSAMKEHVDTIHLMKFKVSKCCEVCGLGFATELKFENHYRKKHSGERIFNCPQCDKSFTTTTCFAEHKRRFHGDAVTCKYCSKVYASLDAYLRHYRHSHRTKDYACNFEGCGKKFATKSLLTYHTPTHTGFKKFICEYCSKCYYTKRDMTRHVKSNHLHIKVQCVVPGCNSVFVRKDTFRIHLFSMHKNLDESILKMYLESAQEVVLDKDEIEKKQY